MAISSMSMAMDQKINDRDHFLAPVASILGPWALWHNPAGLGFMGGTETGLNYLYEWSELGNRHHMSANLAVNLAQVLTLAMGANTKAAFSEASKNKLGTDLCGMVGGAIKLGKTSIGLAIYKAHSFLYNNTSPTLLSLGFQSRPWSFLSVGGLYQQKNSQFFSAPDLTLGISVRPLKEILTIGIDSRFKALGEHWHDGFRTEPIFNIKAEYQGLALALGVEIPGVKDGWNKPIFSLGFETNLAHLGLGVSTMINPSAKNYAIGANIRASSEEWPAVVSPQGLYVKLTIDSDGTLESTPKSFAQKLFIEEESPLSVLAMLRRIENDPSIIGLLLEINGFSFGHARTEEWREAILALQRANKHVTVYLDSPSERDYYIASVADRILMNKQESLSLSGFQATLVYFADMLEKFGIKADAVAAGAYKTAPRRWTESKPQKEEIEVASNILNNFYETMLKDVGVARNINLEKLKTVFDQGEITANEAKSLGLVDAIIDTGDAEQWLLQAPKTPMFFANYEKRKFKQVSWQSPKKIAVIPITNTIVDGRVSPGLFSIFSQATGAKDVIDEIENALDDPDVVGIIVRIDSPGGDAEAGHKIQKALLRAQQEKPVIASMSDVAASAGYLIASGTSHILAMPNTITGSIGVFSLMFSGEKLSEKLGINKQELSPIKNPGSTMWRALNSGEKKQAQKIVDWYYQNFIEAVSIGLKMNKKDVLAKADGHVWLGHEALEKKLVHELGGFIKAVDIMRELANIPTSEQIIIDVRSNTKEQFPLNAKLINLFQSENMSLKPVMPIINPYIKALEAYYLSQGPKAQLPFDIEWPSKKNR